MSIQTFFKTYGGGQVIQPQRLQDIPRNQYMVYALIRNHQPIVVGHGQYNRARVILDTPAVITRPHIKALFVRLYHLFGDPDDHYERFVLVCRHKQEALALESALHSQFGGNSRELPTEIEAALFADFKRYSIPWMLLHMALMSSYDGLADLAGWQRKGLISAQDWALISARLQLS